MIARLYSMRVLECICMSVRLFASAAATVWSWAFAVWLHGDVREMVGRASSPRSIEKICLMTT